MMINNKMSNGYKSLSHAKFHLTIHLILCVKYRKKLLSVPRIEESVKKFVLESENGKKFKILKMEVDQDHLHLLIDFQPSISVGYIAKVIKSQTTQKLWKKYPEFLVKHFWVKKCFWSGGYFACTVGDSSRKTIEYYIENQG